MALSLFASCWSSRTSTHRTLFCYSVIPQNRDTVAQRGKVICPRSPRKLISQPRLEQERLPMSNLLLRGLQGLVGVVLVSSASSLDCSRQRWPPSRVLWLPPPASGYCGRKGDLISFCHSCPSAEKKEHSGLAPCLCTSPGHSISPSADPLALPQTQPSALLLSLQGLLDSSRQPSPSDGLCPGPSQGKAGLFVFCHSIAPPCPCLTPLWPTGWSIH